MVAFATGRSAQPQEEGAEPLRSAPQLQILDVAHRGATLSGEYLRDAMSKDGAFAHDGADACGVEREQP